MAKDLSIEEITQIRIELTDTKSPVRRRAAKKIGKHHLVSLGDELFAAYLNERKDKRTWETQVEMIKALGKLEYADALPYLSEIIAKNERLDTITYAAGLAFVRISRQDKNDIKPILRLMEKGDHCVMNGAMASLAYDKVIPAKEDQKILIDLMDRIPVGRLYEQGCGDAREYLLSAMSKWDKSIVKEYILTYLDHENQNLRVCAEEALKGKCWRAE